MQETSSQLRVRVAMVLLLALLVLSEELKFDAILGAFMAGALIAALTDPDREADLGHLRHKLDGIGFGLFVPVFFVTTGLDLPGEPALLGRVGAVSGSRSSWRCCSRCAGSRRCCSAPRSRRGGRRRPVSSRRRPCRSSSSPPRSGFSSDELRPVNAASLVAAGMLSVLIFPAIALGFLKEPGAAEPQARPWAVRGVRRPGR